MGRISYHRCLATRFTRPRLITDVGTVFVPPHPVDLEDCDGASDSAETSHDTGVTAFERLVDAGRYQLVLSLGWGCGAVPTHTLDLGLLRVDENKLFVVHQLNDDAGTSLILAYLSADVPSRLFRPFLVDYLTSRGTAYTVNLPALLPQSIWIVQPEVAPHATVATGLLGLVTPGAGEWGSVQSGTADAEQRAPHLSRHASLMA